MSPVTSFADAYRFESEASPHTTKLWMEDEREPSCGSQPSGGPSLRTLILLQRRQRRDKYGGEDMATKRGVEVLRPDETCSSCRHLTVGMDSQEAENPENKLNFLFYTCLLTHASYALLNRLSSDTHLVLHFFVRVAKNRQKQDLAIGLVPMPHH